MASSIPVRRSTRTRAKPSSSTDPAVKAEPSNPLRTTTRSRVTTSSAVNPENRPRTRAAAAGGKSSSSTTAVTKSSSSQKVLTHTSVRAAVKKIEAGASSTATALKGKSVDGKESKTTVTRKRGALVEVTRVLSNKDKNSRSSSSVAVSGDAKGKTKVTAMTMDSVKEEEDAEPVALTEAAAATTTTTHANLKSHPAPSTASAASQPPRVFTKPVPREKSSSSTTATTTTTERRVAKRHSGEALDDLDVRASKRRIVIPEEEDEEVVERRRAERRVRDAERLKGLQAEEAKRQEEVRMMMMTEDSLCDTAEVANELIVPSADVTPKEEDLLADELPAVSDEEDQWDDLDQEDMDDPVMVAEYAADAVEYLRKQELETLPNPTYMDSQPELDWDKRSIVVNWLIQVHAHCRLLPETLFLAINILDRFLSARTVSETKFQLVGTTALLLACKFEETYSPSINEMVELTGGIFEREDIIKAERFVLKTLHWSLSNYPGPMSFLRRCSRADNTEVRARTIAKYLCEVAISDTALIATPPSLVAAASMWLGRLVMGREVWTGNMRHYSGYRETEVLGTVAAMIAWILRADNKPSPDNHGLNEALLKKYASRRYLKASVFMYQWATGLWGEGAEVTEEDLRGDLPLLKSHIREEREKQLIAETEQYATIVEDDGSGDA